MDSFFGIGLPELILILLLSGLVMGPHRIRHVAHTLGHWTARLQRVSRQFARQLNAELDAMEGDSVRNTYNDMRELQREVQELRRELGNVPNSLRSQGQDIIDEANVAMKGPSSTPPTDAADTSPGQAEEAASLDIPSSPEPPPDVSSLPKAIEIPGDPD